MANEDSESVSESVVSELELQSDQESEQELEQSQSQSQSQSSQETSTSSRSRIEEVLKDATTDLQNAKLPGFVRKTLVPVTTKAAEVVPVAASKIPLPLPFVDKVGAFALSIPLSAMKLGYSIVQVQVPRSRGGTSGSRSCGEGEGEGVCDVWDPNEFAQVLGISNCELTRQFKKLTEQSLFEGITLSESERIKAFQDQQITFLVEIVGCENLIARDCNQSSDPYVIVRFRSNELHRTKHQRQSLNPVYTLRDKSFFLFTTSVRDLFFLDTGSYANSDAVADVVENGLMFEVCDNDRITSDGDLGIAIVPPKDIYSAHEERLVYPIEPRWDISDQEDQGQDDISDMNTQGTIAIRIRRATDYDKEFMATFQGYDKSDDTTAVLVERDDGKRRGEQGMNMLESMMPKVKMTVRDGKKVKQFKILPFPDPKSVTDAHATIGTSVGTSTASESRKDRVWKTADEIELITMQPSRHYQHIGSGKIARVYLEVLACNNLPNMERIQFLGNKTDAFVQIVYEDCICKTDVIDNKNNPRFLPWTNRAFVLHSHYPSSVINLGVFDHDAGIGFVGGHDFIGRTSVDLATVRPGTEYTLDYKLYDTALVEERASNGTIRIRIRMEIDDPRKYLLASLALPPPRYVNCNTTKQFKCVHQTIHGERDMNRYSIITIFDLVAELLNYKHAYYYTVAFIRSLLLWRGSHRLMTIGGKELYFPFNSLCVFLMAITLNEKPYLLPSFSFLALALTLLTSMRWRNNHPNPWWRSHRFAELLKVLLFGKFASLSPETIGVDKEAAKRAAKEAEKFDVSWKKLIEAAEAKAETDAEKRVEEEEAFYEKLQDAGGTDVEISSQLLRSKISNLRVSKKFLFPLQKILLQVCKWLRFTKNVLLWEEPLSFWITLISLALSIAFVKLRVVQRFLWVSGHIIKISTWIVFGPWMKIVDVCFIQTEVDNSEGALIKATTSRLDEDDLKAIQEIRERNELTLKLRDFRRYFFGRFLTKVPILKYAPQVDLPLSSSLAKPWVEGNKEDLCTSSSLEDRELIARKPGQQLTGLMIPRLREPQCGGNKKNAETLHEINNGGIIAAVLLPIMLSLGLFAHNLTHQA